MKVKINEEHVTTEVFAKRLFYNLWLVSSVAGMGVFQDRGVVPQEVVIERAINDTEYSGTRPLPNGKLYGDYIFGRMMKTGFEWNEKEISIPDSYQKPRLNYQSWARQYPTIEKAVMTTADDLGCTVTITQ